MRLFGRKKKQEITPDQRAAFDRGFKAFETQQEAAAERAAHAADAELLEREDVQTGIRQALEDVVVTEIVETPNAYEVHYGYACDPDESAGLASDRLVLEDPSPGTWVIE